MFGIDRFLPDLLEDAALLGAEADQVEGLISSHLALRDTPAGDATATLVVPASLVTRLREVVDPDQDLRISLFGDTGLDGLGLARDALQDDAWITLDHVLLPVHGAGRSSADVVALLDSLSFTVPTYFELPVDDDLDQSLDVLAGDGAERAAFTVTTHEALAKAIIGAVRRSVPFTLSASGHPVAPLLAATALATASPQVADVVQALRTEDSASLAHLLDGQHATTVRRHLRSVSCHSVTEAFASLTSISRTDHAQ